MKKIKLFLIAFIFFSGVKLVAGPGDTIVVQTIDFNTPVLPGWNSPRSGTYLFPPDSISFSKILMYYTLKCDPDQNPQCGEWDYTTHTYYVEHTGTYDSNLYYHDNYQVNNQSPDSFPAMNDTSWLYVPVMEYFNNTPATYEAEITDGNSSMILPLEDTTPDGRFQVVYNASDLQAAGFQAGDITGIKLNVLSGNINLKHFTVRMLNFTGGGLTQDSLITAGLQTVYERNTLLQTGWNTLSLTYPFTWDGTSDLLIDYSYSDHSGTATLEADYGSYSSALYSRKKDYFLDFEGWDYIDVPADAFSTIDSAITISFWQYGNPDIQPANQSIIRGIDSAGNRVLNIHLPWSNKHIYWDAGRDSNGYDRIERIASNESEWEGRWNHWTFTKDCRSGLMRIYHNGQLWYQHSGLRKSMAGVTKFRIAAPFGNSGYYAGMIDEFRVWDTVVDWDLIKDYLYKDADSFHPLWNHLKVYYRFNEGEGTTVSDNSDNSYTGTMFGLPEWKNYNGTGRFRNPDLAPLDVHIALQNGNYNPASLDSVLTVDTTAKGAVNIVLFDSLNPPVATDTLIRWPGYYSFTFDSAGNATDSTLITPDTVFYHEDYPYYGEPYEIINHWEMGRFITPYGNGLDLGDGFTWVYDVTDYEPFLHDSVHLKAGNFQELLDLKFYMIEGTPPRDVKKIEKVYSGYYYLSQFPEKVPPDTIALIPDATTFKIKTRTSGHLFSNPENCAEFCPKVHTLLVNNEVAGQWQMLQECSTNPLYPQGGTWIYDRSGWCPGMKVTEHDFEITPFVTDDTIVVDYNSQAGQYGTYNLEVQLFSFGSPNFNTDVSVEEIINPNNAKRYARFNPSASKPLIVIENRGADTLTSVDIVYGPRGAAPKTYHWTGFLGFLESEQVQLDVFDWDDWQQGNGKFDVELSMPNNTQDENPINNTLTSSYDLPPVYPATFVIHFKTNKAAYQNNWEIRKDDGTLLYERDNFDNLTLYVDTVTFINGIYDFCLWDSGDNGISFWANNEGSGYLKFYDMDGELIKQFNGDFGHNIYQCFYADMYLGSNRTASNNLAFDILSNPNDGKFTLSYALKEPGNISVKITDISGKTVYTDSRYSNNLHGKIYVRLPGAAAGVYSCTFTANGYSESKKLIIK